MADLRVTFENDRSGEVLELSEISDNGSGVEAVSGATGFGLPPIQWFETETAGDGNRATDYRVPAKDLDIPLFISVENRTDLKEKTAALSRVVAGKFWLRLYEDDELYREMLVYRVGGGTYTYGEDTTGETDWQSILTVRASKPYWLHADSVTVVRGSAVDDDSFTLTNIGTARVKPIWRFAGPLTSLSVTEVSTGRQFAWDGALGAGNVITIDCEKATCVDSFGNNLYEGLAPAPDLFALEPGDTDVEVTVEHEGDLDVVRTNYVTNPTFGNPTHGWTTDDADRVSVVGGELQVGDGGANGEHTSATLTISGLGSHEGETFQVLAKLSGHSDRSLALNEPHILTVTYDTFGGGGGGTDGGGGGGPSTTRTDTFTTFGRDLFVSLTFMMTSDGTVTFTVTDARRVGVYPPTYLDLLYVGTPGTYFDGGTTDTADYTYAWTGTANASTSTAIPSGIAVPHCEIEFLPRDWMVV